MELSQLFDKYIFLHHERAVWSLLRQQLSQFMPTDFGDPQKAIAADDGVSSAVRFEAISRVAAALEANILALSKEIETYGTMDFSPKKTIAPPVQKKLAKRAVKKVTHGS